MSMAVNNFFISVDEHVQEPPDLWTKRLSHGNWGERIPHVETTSDGVEHWIVNGSKIDLDGIADCGAVMPERTKNPQRWSEVPASVYDARERLKVMDAAGIDYAALYPTVAGSGGQNFGRIEDPELELACVQAYNDWLLEEWVSVSDRFIPQCLTPLFPVDAAVKEIRRSVANGHKGVIYPSVPMELRDVPHINESVYDPLWAACQELSVPICFHAGASSAIQIPAYEGYSPTIAAAFQAIARPASSVSVLVNLLISKILMRFPGLKVVLAESGLGWGAYLLEYTDYQAKGDQLPQNGYDLMPSEMFRRNCYVVGWYDQASLRVRKYIGSENILWSSQFPLATSTWPNTKEAMTRSFDGVDVNDRQKILWENAAKLYKIHLNS
ncbi:MAG TPA: amidohydrolase family protein [Candidatus Binatia bacterium]|jgi:predicted TIM-barrel fold metal-dependent hydrolase|nr:amidohydrolase family protein [Candidatus Binatia bacterium]